jgi:hypothetical protein
VVAGLSRKRDWDLLQPRKVLFLGRRQACLTRSFDEEVPEVALKRPSKGRCTIDCGNDWPVPKGVVSCAGRRIALSAPAKVYFWLPIQGNGYAGRRRTRL